VIEKYHKYVFDIVNQKFIGDFETMYQNEEKEGYCSWYQDDLRDLGYVISYDILNQYNFNNILDLGCGEGMFVSLLKKKNNKITAVDVSPTAIAKAKLRFKDIDFKIEDINNLILTEQYDLVMLKEVLSYIERWKEMLKTISEHTLYIYITLDLPTDHPLGFVKTHEEIIEEIKKYFTIETQVFITTANQLLLLARKKIWRTENWSKPEIDKDGWTTYGWRCQYPENLKLGHGTDIGCFSYLNAKYGIEIQDNVQIGSHCSIYTESTEDNKFGRVTIKEGATIGTHSTVMPGITIGRNAKVGAHTFVNKDVPDNVIAFGCPVRIKGSI